MAAQTSVGHGGFSLRCRFALAMVIVVVALAAGMIGLLSHQYRQVLLADYGAEMSESVRMNGMRVQREIDELRRDILFLADVPPVHGLIRASLNGGIDPTGKTDAAAWAQRLADILGAFTKSHPEYVRARLVAVAGEGREIVRVEQQDMAVRKISIDQHLGTPAAEALDAAIRLRPGEVHLSEFVFERNADEPGLPGRPTLRAATPVFAPGGQLFGVVELTFDLRALQQHLSSPMAETSIYLATADGDYLSHPLRSPGLGSAEMRHRWQDDFPTLALDAAGFQHLPSVAGGSFAVARRLAFDPLLPDRYLVIFQTLPESRLDRQINEVLWLTAGSVVAIALALIALLWWMLRRQFAPLEQLTSVARDIAAGRYEAQLPPALPGEIGQFVRAFDVMQQAVAEREARYGAITDTCGDGFLMVDRSGYILGTNDAYLAKSGYARDELLGMHLNQLDTRETPEETHGRIEAALSAGSLLFESEHKRKDGSRWPVEVRVSCWPAGNGLTFGFVRDISERLQGQRQLLASEELSRSIMDSLRSCIAVLDAKGVIVRTNATWQASAAASNAEPSLQAGIGLDYLAVCRRASAAEPLAAKALEGIESVLAGRALAFDMEYPHQSPSGEERWFAMSVRPLKSVTPGAVISHLDITEHKLSELALESRRWALEFEVAERTKELARARHEMQSILDNTPAMIGYWDRDMRNVFGNHAYVTWFGMMPDEMRGRHIRELLGDRIFELNRPYIEGVLRGEPQEFEREIPCPDGHVRYSLARYVPDLQDGEIRGFFVHVTDVTQIKAAEAAAARAARVKGEFLANMSHEIRTPLNAVLSFARIGERASHGRGTAATFRRILESGQLLLGIVDDILDFSKIEAGKLTFESVAFDLGEAIDRAVDAAALPAYAKGLEFVIDETPDLARTWKGDPLRLGQVLVNLIGNAIKFTHCGRVTLVVRKTETGLLFRIADTGIGMTPEQVGRLFQPFEQGDGSTTRRFGGTGLGLAICQRLVELMGGTIDVSSRLGEGSVFEVALPMLPLDGAPLRTSGHVVLVGQEDSEIDRVALALRSRGVHVSLLAPISGLQAHADLVVMFPATLEDCQSVAVEAAAEAGRRICFVCTPGREEAERLPHGRGCCAIERPVRVRHVLDALAGKEVAHRTASPLAPRLSGLRILAVEDNEPNRLVLTQLLGQEGAFVTLADNGVDAVERLAADGTSAYDLVITDVQMPRMDGYELTRRIAAMAPDLPVIGLTAHAMAEEQERCIAAGMLDCLTKPIDLERLIAAVRQIASTFHEDSGTTGRTEATVPTAAPAIAGVVDWEALRYRFRGNDSFVTQLVESVLSSESDTPVRLREAAGSNDLAALATLAHRVKGMAGSIMASSVLGLAASTEKAARTNLDTAVRQALSLAGAVEMLLADLRTRAQSCGEEKCR